ncbi:glycoside hydrolase family 16 protein [Macroventuria anomochaeta]|uniref:Glycoside hydrolase family 16 protein n=1 Tax=Macroventuria anomochaeta TaxID=301207 RepID=A0ACB6SD44_9PLEO|nr:glycoside hydrolase family 16 protein [Macroventuria anomochaeta]KAF2631888.1 glycoside hydrolase family 16 protein [Macroventuria anomochaeta]
MPSFTRLSASLLPLTAFALATSPYTSSRNETPKDNNADCNCYVVSTGADSNTPEYFQYYRFYDFRNLPGGLSEAPGQVNDSMGLEPTWQPDLFNSDDWNYDWATQNWSKPATEDFPVPMSNSYANIYLAEENDSSYLALRTSRESDFQSASEMENHQKNLMHVSMRMYGRVVGDKGAVAGFFTFVDDDNESDIEILTRDPIDTIRYTNQPSVGKDGNEVAQASVAGTDLPSWEDWQTHRIDWLPKNSYWYLNGKQVAANTYSVPRKQSYMVLNMWSDGGEWSGNMTEDHSAEFHVQWIEMTFNTSGSYQGKNEKRASKGCETVCKIDGVKQIGTPEVVSVNKSAAAAMGVSWGLLAVVGAVSMFVGL